MEETSRKTPYFSNPLFLGTRLGFAALWIFLWGYFFPQVAARELAAGIFSVLAWFVGWVLFNCFVEYLLHRYVLHMIAIGSFSYFAGEHRRHHRLTQVHIDPATHRAVNHYPVTEEEQYRAATFPWYALPLFLGIYTAFCAALGSFLPDAPVFLAGYLSVAWSYCSYEVWHAMEHRSYAEFWRRFTEHPRWGSLWRKVYAFHLEHHRTPMHNLAISGFFFLPVADWVFGTIILPKHLPLDGAVVDPAEFLNRAPRFLGPLDRFALGRERKWHARRS